MILTKWGICTKCGKIMPLWGEGWGRDKDFCCNQKMVELNDPENAEIDKRGQIVPDKWGTESERIDAFLKYKSELRRKYLPNMREDEIQNIYNEELFRCLEIGKKQKIEAALEQARQASKVNVTCPYCKSTNCSKISGLSKATSVVLWGIFSQKHKYRWHCNKCRSDF